MTIRKSTGAAATGLARQITGQGEQVEQMALRTGTITAVNKSAVPWTATVNLSNVLVPGVTMLGWYDPQVGDRVQIMKQGPVLLIMGTLAPGKLHTTVVGAPPSRPATELAPVAPAEASTRVVNVSATSSSTYLGSGVWDDSVLIQGGGILQRAFFFYGNQIREARGNGTVLSASILLRREEEGAGEGYANVNLGWHAHGAKTQTPAGTSGTTFLGQLVRGQGKAFELPASLVGVMNGATTNIGFSLNPTEIGLKSPDYLRLVPFRAESEWSGSLSLTIRG